MIDGEVITSPLTGTILPGVTRDSVLTLLRKWGVPANERKLSTDELFAAAKAGKLQEVFASGTAAVISPITPLGMARLGPLPSGSMIPYMVCRPARCPTTWAGRYRSDPMDPGRPRFPRLPGAIFGLNDGKAGNSHCKMLKLWT